MRKLMPPFSSIPYILVIAVFSNPILANSATLDTDIQVLRAIKSCVDPNSILANSYLNSWDFTTDPCETTGRQFQGVLCSLVTDNSSSSRVTGINLDDIGYEGFIPPAIGNLTELTFINLRSNYFRGPIPNSIGNLMKLTRLSLSNNFLTGVIPTGLSTLKKLQVLDISFNMLTGAIPPGIGGLRSLTYLSICNNALTGRIPDLSGLWQLETLDLSRNHLYGSVPNVPVSLRTLVLSHNSLSGHLGRFNKLRNLRFLDVSDNTLTGTMTREFFNLPKVAQLNVSQNHLTKLEIFSFMGQGANLKVIDARANRLRGRLPVSLVVFQNLTTINLSHNQFYGHVPEEYGSRVGAWENLYLDHNFLIGQLPKEFAENPPRIKGSLSNNCLRCPNVPLCNGGQRKASECLGQRVENSG